MWHRLALHLGGTVAELQERMSSAEFTQWIAYSMKEPFGYHIDNFRMGQVAATVFNVARGKKTSAVSPSVFYPESKRLKSKRELTKRQQEYVREKRERRPPQPAKQAPKHGKRKRD